MTEPRASTRVTEKDFLLDELPVDVLPDRYRKQDHGHGQGGNDQVGHELTNHHPPDALEHS